ncbi:hypothetical protein [Pseudomonas sp. UMAB-40]|uniref:hypothetical protein n=1 Tax=Pseudomonas sp. UMAB-40 TaxID=1365407 RepID=UPI001C576AAB|nr:hypothetical protein [Pseudomonas sp. UMAB-40]
MSESPSLPAPIHAGHLERIKQDALRGIGASSGDTLRLVEELSRFLRDPEKFRCKTCYFEWTGTKDHPDTDCGAPDVRAGWRP